MSEKWTAISGIMAVATFILAPLFFFLTTPPSVREVTLMVVSAVFGVCIAWFVAVLVSGNRIAPASRQGRLDDLRRKLVKLSIEIETAIGSERTFRLQADEARRNRMNDVASDFESSATKADIIHRSVQDEYLLIEREIERLSNMSDRAWRREQRKAGNHWRHTIQ